MDRRTFLASSGAAALSATLLARTTFAQAPAAAGPGDAALKGRFDAIVQEMMQRNPNIATMFGLDTGPNAALRSKLSDTSPASRAEDAAALQQAIASIQVDESQLSPQMALDRDVIEAVLSDYAVGPTRFQVDSPVYPFRVTQQDGAYFSIPDFLNSQHPVNTAADADAYLARLEAFAGSLDGDTETLKGDAARGIVPPDVSFALALGQMEALRKPAPAESGLATSLSGRAKAKNIAGDWNGRAAKIVADKVYPALDRQMALVKQLHAKGRKTAGVWDIPQGEALYAAALASSTTTRMTADEVHKVGLDQVAEISARLDTILKKEGLSQGSVGARLTQLNKSPAQLYPDTAEGRRQLIADLNAGVKDMEGRLPRMFATLPGVPIEIRAVPTDIQNGAPNGYYTPAALDGSRAAIYWINLKNVGDWPKYTLPALTYHEADPGHHLQNSVATQASDSHLLRKLSWFGAYGEGWALYAESVADELGGYKTEVERAGFLQSYLFRAARLVVDTGIHTKRWTADQATKYLVETTGFPQPRSQREVERYTCSPGQACSYKIGHIAWVEARRKAQAMLGDRFDLKQFHEVLRDGAMPLTMLQERVEARAKALA